MLRYGRYQVPTLLSTLGVRKHVILPWLKISMPRIFRPVDKLLLAERVQHVGSRHSGGTHIYLPVVVLLLLKVGKVLYIIEHVVLSRLQYIRYVHLLILVNLPYTDNIGDPRHKDSSSSLRIFIGCTVTILLGLLQS